jgi:SAM-dependent methyltransferase
LHSNKSDAHARFSKAEYVGFDFHPGPNVDVVGDAHRLSEYFEKESFDIIYSIAVFEHLAMPWVVATEIARLLKPGGIVLVKTHLSYGSHERPWHFFQFSDMALRVLFSPALGFECIEAGASNPMVGRFSALAEAPLRFRAINGLYCGSEFLGRKIKDVSQFAWNDVHPDEVVGGTEYPRPKAVAP